MCLTGFAPVSSIKDLTSFLDQREVVHLLEEPGEDGRGTYLMAQIDGAGVIVRGWSAGMGGVLKVFLDGAEDPIRSRASLGRLEEVIHRGSE